MNPQAVRPSPVARAARQCSGPRQLAVAAGPLILAGAAQLIRMLALNSADPLAGQTLTLLLLPPVAE